MRLSPASLLPFLTLAVLPTAAEAAGPAPRHPVSLRASTGDHSVVLHWRAAKNLQRIRIYRRRQGHNWLRIPIATVEGSTRTYVDRGLHNGRRYYYRLRAVGRNGRYSKVSRSTAVRVRSLKTKRTTPRKGTPIPGSGSSPSPLTAPGGRAPSTTPSGTAAGAAPVIPPLALGDPWSWDARSAALDPDNATLSARLIANVNRPNLSLSDWAVATADAKAGDPEYSIPRTQQGGSITLRIPAGTRPDGSDDGHLTVRDLERGIETDFWRARFDSATGRISTTSAAVTFPLNAVNVGKGWAGDAANTPLRRGLITAEDLKAAIDTNASLPYTLQFGLPNIAGGAARYPALHNVPTGDQSSVVEGTWVRLDPSFDVEGSGLPAWQKVIARTLQSRGAVNRDNAGAFSIYARNPLNGEAPWSLVGLSGVAAGFSSSFPWSRLQVLSPPGR